MKLKTFWFFVVAVGFFVITQIKFTAWPEMLLWPYLMLKGWLPYKDIAIAHNPLLLFLLTIFYKIFGLGLLQLKVFTWLLIALTGLTIYWVTKKLWGEHLARISALFIIPLSIYYEGNGLWFDLALAVIYPLIFYFSEVKKYFWAGVFFALAFLLKQTAVFILIPVIFSLLGNKAIKRTEMFISGAFSVALPFLLIVFLLKIMPEYIFWAYRFAGGSLPFSEGQIFFPGIKQFLLGIFPLFMFLCLVFVKNNRNYINLFAWVFFGSLGIYPRWELFHFLPIIGFLSMIYALLINESVRFVNLQRYVIILFFILLTLLVGKKVVSGWHRETRFLEKDVLLTSDFVKNNIKSDDKIFVLNAWDNFYPLTDTLPAIKPWIPQFPWYLKIGDSEDKMLADLVIQKPVLVIMHPYSQSGLDSYRPQKLADFIEKFYLPVEQYGDFIILKRY